MRARRGDFAFARQLSGKPEKLTGFSGRFGFRSQTLPSTCDKGSPRSR
ncbi:MAG: hypothetical protein ACKVRN_12150 [Pyrinomonadaceae bacterium]